MATILKVEYNGDIYRLSLAGMGPDAAGSPTYAAIEKLVCDCLPAVAEQLGSSIQMKYADEDGDMCTLAQSTFADFLSVASVQGLPKLHLVSLPPPAFTAAEPMEQDGEGENWARIGRELGENWARTGRELGENWESLSGQSCEVWGGTAPVASGSTAGPTAAAATLPAHVSQIVASVSDVPASGNSISLHWHVWSAWQNNGAVCWSVQADVQNWIPGATFKLHLPAGSSIVNPFSADVLNSHEDGTVTLKLASYPTTCFGGTFSCHTADVATATQSLLHALSSPGSDR